MNERKKMHCTICTICTMEGKVQKVQKVQGKKMTWDSWDSETVEWGVIPFKQGKVSSVSRVSCNFLYYRHPMLGNGRRMKKTQDFPRNYQERKSCLLGGGAGRSSSDRSSYRVIDRSKGVILPLDLGGYRFCLHGGWGFDRHVKFSFFPCCLHWHLLFFVVRR